MIKRFIGLILILTAILGLSLSYLGWRSGHRVVDSSQILIDQQLAVAADTLATTQQALILSRVSLSDLSDGIATLEQTSTDLATTLRESKPMLQQTTQLISYDLPESIEALQDTMPDVIQVAAAVDTALTTLNKFKIDEEILGYRIYYDLGIQYEPTIPFDQSIAQINDSLDPLPPRLRSMEIYVGVAENNLDQMNQDLLAIADDLEKIQADVDESEPVINAYIDTIQTETSYLQAARDGLPAQAKAAKRAINLSLLWLALMQIVPLYLGWELLSNWRDASPNGTTVTTDHDPADVVVPANEDDASTESRPDPVADAVVDDDSLSVVDKSSAVQDEQETHDGKAARDDQEPGIEQTPIDAQELSDGH